MNEQQRQQAAWSVLQSTLEILRSQYGVELTVATSTEELSPGVTIVKSSLALKCLPIFVVSSQDEDEVDDDPD